MSGYPLRRSEKQSNAQPPQKTNPASGGPLGQDCENPREDLESSQQNEAQGSELVDRPLDMNPHSFREDACIGK